MLRNSLGQLTKCAYKQTNRNASLSSCRYAKNSNSGLNRQSKIMSKLFGNRLTGSKKRWYPDSGQMEQHNSVFKAAHLSKPGSAGKNSIRRMAVLNKLFMEQISSLMAMGNISESILGKGVQLTRVKIAPDFASINVYWMAKGEAEQDGMLMDELKKCSGLLRHELSQLRVMGEVPRINFIHDRSLANVEHVNNLLRNMDLEYEEADNESGSESDIAVIANDRDEELKILSPLTGDKKGLSNENALIKEEFFGNAEIKTKTPDSNANDAAASANFIESLPPMRHDVFGLDHRSIMARITSKMKKSKLAWDTHNQRQLTEDSSSEGAAIAKNTLSSVQQRVQEADERIDDFRKFLAQRRKNTPERKKYYREDNLIPTSSEGFNDFPTDRVLSAQQQKIFNEEDYLIDEHDKKP